MSSASTCPNKYFYKGINSATELCYDVMTSFERYHVKKIITDIGTSIIATFSVVHEVRTLAQQ